jgi:hypothetical protein
MAANAPVIKVTGIENLAKAINAHDRSVKRVIGGQFLFAKQEAVGFMKVNAPWTDRTANARNGLHAETEFGPEQHFYAQLVLAHSVFYGIYLETRFSGKYAILMPTINYIGPLILSRIASSIKQMEAMQ